jgi:hypothetical protein
MGQNWWWLKLFSICLMLELQMHWFCSMNQRKAAKKISLNIVQFKMKLVEDLLGRIIDNLFEGGRGQVEQRTPVHIEGGVLHIEGGVRLQCAYGALMS